MDIPLREAGTLRVPVLEDHDRGVGVGYLEGTRPSSQESSCRPPETGYLEGTRLCLFLRVEPSRVTHSVDSLVSFSHHYYGS